MIKTISWLTGLMLLIIGSVELPRLLTTNASSSTILTISAGTTSFPRQLRDATGETLTLSSPPQRIVSQTLATDEILLALCPLERITAVSTLAQNATYSNVATQARQITTLPTNNIEAILAQQPDLILVANYNRAETIELLKTTGIPIFHFANFDSLADIKNNIRTIGYLIGEEQRATSLLAQMEHDLAEIRAHLPQGHKPPRVLSYSIDNYTAGAHTTFDDMLTWVKAINVATEHGIEQHTKINEEQILAWQPDVIVTPAAPTELTQTRQQLLAKPAIAASKAGQTGRIIAIDNRYLLPVSQYIVSGIKALTKELYD